MERKQLAVKYRRVTQAELIEFFSSIDVTPRCATCGGSDFALPLLQQLSLGSLSDEPADYLSPFTLHDPVIGSDEVLFSLTCNRCGTVLLINARNVVAWKESRQHEVAADAQGD